DGMSSLTDIEKRYFESLLGMSGGYVMDYTDQTFDEFFKRHRVAIHDVKYQTYGSSKAKKLRSFWEQEPDALVGKVLSELLDASEAIGTLNGQQSDSTVLAKARGIVARLEGKVMSSAASAAQTVDDFLHSEFTIPNIQKLPIEAQAVPIIES